MRISLIILLLLTGNVSANEASDTLNAALAVPGAVISLPPGEYRIDVPVFVPAQGRFVMPHGVIISPAKTFAGEAFVIASGTADSRLNECQIVGLKIDAKNRPITCFLSDRTRCLWLDDCFFYRSQTSGLVIRNAWDFNVRRCVVQWCGSTELPAVELSGEVGPEGMATGWMSECKIEAFPGIGMDCTNLKSLWLSDMKFHGVMKSKGRSTLGVRFTRCDGVRMRDPLLTLVKEKWSKSEDCYDVVVSEPIDRTKVRR